MNQEESVVSFLDILTLMRAGRATVTVGGRPFLSVDSSGKMLDVEVDGAREAGLRLSDLVRLQEGSTSILEGSRHVIRALSRLGWTLTLSAEGDRIITMGSRVSRLTGRMTMNPFRVKKLLDALS